MTLDEYLDAALARCGFTADRQLNNALNLSHAGVTHLRCKRMLPSDGTMIALAKLAGVDPAQALLELNSWRSKSSEAQLLYSELARRLASSVMLALFIVFEGGTIMEQISPALPNTIHYAIFRRRNRSQIYTRWVSIAAVIRTALLPLSPRVATSRPQFCHGVAA